MDTFYFVLIILALVGIFLLLVRWEKRSKKNYKEKANDLLLTSDPDPKELVDTIKNLRLYAGHFRKDKEAISLVTALQNKHGHLLIK
jgi:hypothetical protein